jgi:hypothetical protein
MGTPEAICAELAVTALADAEFCLTTPTADCLVDAGVSTTTVAGVCTLAELGITVCLSRLCAELCLTTPLLASTAVVGCVKDDCLGMVGCACCVVLEEADFAVDPKALDVAIGTIVRILKDGDAASTAVAVEGGGDDRDLEGPAREGLAALEAPREGTLTTRSALPLDATREAVLRAEALSMSVVVLGAAATGVTRVVVTRSEVIGAKATVAGAFSISAALVLDVDIEVTGARVTVVEVVTVEPLEIILCELRGVPARELPCGVAASAPPERTVLCGIPVIGFGMAACPAGVDAICKTGVFKLPPALMPPAEAEPPFVILPCPAAPLQLWLKPLIPAVPSCIPRVISVRCVSPVNLLDSRTSHTVMDPKERS